MSFIKLKNSSLFQLKEKNNDNDIYSNNVTKKNYNKNINYAFPYKTNLLFYFLISILNLFIKTTNSQNIISIENNPNLKYSGFVKNTTIGFMLFFQEKLNDITNTLPITDYIADIKAPLVEASEEKKFTFKSNNIFPFSILQSFYVQNSNRNLTYGSEYIINYRVDESIIPQDIFRAVGDLSRVETNYHRNLFEDEPINFYNNNNKIDIDNNIDKNIDNNIDNEYYDYKEKRILQRGSNIRPSNSNLRPPNRERRVLNCTYMHQGLIFNNKINLDSKSINFTYSKIENFMGLNFALTQDKRIISLEKDYYSDRFIESPIREIEKNNNTKNDIFSINKNTFDNFYLINQLFETGTFIFAEKANNLYVYNITTLDESGYYEVDFYANLDISFLGELATNTSPVIPTNNSTTNITINNNNEKIIITKYATYHEDIIISTLNKGLIYLTKKSSFDTRQAKYLTKVEFENKQIDLRIKDMSVNNYTIYIIVENVGLKILDIKNWSFTNFEFIHPSLIKFDSVLPTTTLTAFYGILVDNSSPAINEFFIEFKYRNSEVNLEFNKIFISEKKTDEKNLVSFTNFLNMGIILDKKSKNLIFLTRGISNFIDTYNYRLNLLDIFGKENFIDENFDIFFISENTAYFSPLIVIRLSNGKLIYINKISSGEISLTCRFNQSGENMLNFIFSNICRNLNSISNYNAIKSCPYLIRIPMNVERGMSAILWIIIVIVSILILGFVIYVILCFGGKARKLVGYMPNNVKNEREIDIDSNNHNNYAYGNPNSKNENANEIEVAVIPNNNSNFNQKYQQ
jgi:hypothetical protein